MKTNGKIMNDEVLELVARRFKAMSEPTRLKILQLLKDQEMSVGEIAEQADLKHGTASANLNALQNAGLVSNRREGNRMLYRIEDELVFELCHLVCGSLKSEFQDYAKLSREL